MPAARLPVQGHTAARLVTKPVAPAVLLPTARPPSSRAATGAAATTSSLASSSAAVAGPGFNIDPPAKAHGPVTVPTVVLAPHQILDALVAAVHPDDADRYKALYSSDLGGVITEPALMVVAADDHGVHRGHAVFDTAALIEGRIYLLDAHLDRFFASAASAGLALPYSRAQVRRVVLETAAAAGVMDASIRLWLGAGRGGYGLSPAECRRPSLHVAVYTPRRSGGEKHGTPSTSNGGEPGGLAVYTAKGVAPPDAWAAGIKSTNYLRNALAQAEAEAAGFDLGVFADPATGAVTEAANASLGIITQGGELVIPPWDRALPGVTAQRVLDLLPQWLNWSADLRAVVSTVTRRPFTVAEAHAAKFAFAMGTTLKVAPIVRWDGAVIGDGSPGLPVLVMKELMESDMDPVSEGAGERFVTVPF